VSTLKRLARYSCAELNSWRLPGPRWRGTSSLMKVSGIYGESSLKNCAVPVAGNFESMALGATPKKTLRPDFLAPSHFSTINNRRITAYAEFPNTLLKDDGGAHRSWYRLDTDIKEDRLVWLLAKVSNTAYKTHAERQGRDPSQGLEIGIGSLLPRGRIIPVPVPA
jgi:hypothetical protein